MHFYDRSKVYTFKKTVFITCPVFSLPVRFPVNAEYIVSIRRFTHR